MPALIAEIRRESDDTFIQMDPDRVPRCCAKTDVGDFCDVCGDCIVCNSEDACISAKEHRWIVYE